VPPEAAAVVGAFDAARSRLAALWEELRAAFPRALAEQTARLRAAASGARFQEAVIWQNRHAFHTAVESLLKGEAGGRRDTRQRQHEELVAKYLQRYSTKNDTIGTFGPVGWARLSEGGPLLTAAPGPSLVAERNCYFEVWCVDELARVFAENPAHRPWLVPARMPYVDLQGASLVVPRRPPIRISEGQAALLRACDGERNAHEAAAEVLRSHPSEFRSEADVFNVLEIFRRNQLITWGLEVPLVPRPELTLRGWFERIGDDALRGKVFRMYDRLVGAGRAVAEAAGDAPRLDRALGDLEAAFTNLTSAASTRLPGRTYAARTLIYEDSRRDAEVTLGPEFLRVLGEPLSLLLASARWMTYEVAGLARELMREVFRETARRTNSTTVEFTEYHEALRPHLFGDRTRRLVVRARGLLLRKWAEVLAVPPGSRAVEYRSEELRPRVAEQFDAPHAGWLQAVYHSPDVLIAAASPEAAREGRYRVVLGEMHVAWNTLLWWLFVGQHPAPEDFARACAADIPEPRVRFLVHKQHWAAASARLMPALAPEKDFWLEMAPTASHVARGRVLGIGALVAEERGGDIILRTRDGRASFDALEAYSEQLSSDLSSAFTILTPDPHRPRVTIDGLIVCREGWRFAAPDLAWAAIKDEAERFVAVRRWARAHGMPRFVFVTAPVEVKPFYTDLDSPVYISLLSKVVRQAAAAGPDERAVTFTEMLPAPDEAWLPDSEGARYTSEFRLVAVDAARRP
ncbi:MAG TPA: lantibiotic dehydratase, partial [Pyrinomonadaceae bacterium]|nr:lantibiotic dehydratase [Pyrinomonadaceae bacterium]